MTKFHIVYAGRNRSDAFAEQKDLLHVRILMNDEFADAVQTGKLPIILADDPYATDINSREPSALNTRNIVYSLYGSAGNYDWDNNVFNIYITLDSICMNLQSTPMAEFERRVTEVLNNPIPAPKPPKLK